MSRTKSKKSSKGFSAIEAVVVVLVVVVIGLGGWYVWQKNKDDKATENSNETTQSGGSQSQSTEEEPNVLALADGTVQLTLPEDWPFIKGSPNYCVVSATTDVSCEEGVIINPEVKQAAQAGGPDYFGIAVSVYNNQNGSSAQRWLEHDLDEGSASPTDIVSHASINGYETYYWMKIYSGDGTSFRDLYYVFAAHGKIVLISARTYAPRTLSDGTQVGDFRRFEAGITEMAKSIKID